MRWAVLTLNSQGIDIGMQLYEMGRDREDFEVDIYTNKPTDREEVRLFELPVSQFYEQMSDGYDAIIYIMAMGIIVRSIQPRDKRYDKPVICIQLRGEYVIPVIGGHLGGANEVATQIAEHLGAQAVITTASDLCQLDSVDMIAKKKGWSLLDMEGAKKVTADWVEGKKSLILSEVPLEGLSLEAEHIHAVYDSKAWFESDLKEDYTSLLMITSNKKGNIAKQLHIERHVQLIPKHLVLGIGCRKGISYEHIHASVNRFMMEAGYYEEAIGMVASIDLKREEEGIVKWAEHKQVPFVTYTAADLDDVMDKFEGSRFVQSVTGSRGVCMPAGYIASNYGECVVKKQVDNGVTLSLWKRR